MPNPMKFENGEYMEMTDEEVKKEIEQNKIIEEMQRQQEQINITTN